MTFEEAARLKREIDEMTFWTAMGPLVRDSGSGFSVKRDYCLSLTYENPLTGIYIIEEPIMVWSQEEWLAVKANIEPTKVRRK